MKKSIVLVAFIMFCSVNLFAEDMCERYVQHVKNNEVEAVKIGECHRTLYAACTKYADGNTQMMEVCLDNLHYGEKIASR